MNRDFFIKLVFATHKVADALPDEEEVKQEIKNSANTLLVDLILFSEKEAVSSERKRVLVPRLRKEIEAVFAGFYRAEKEGWVNPRNFSILEKEYERVREMLEFFGDIQEEEPSEVKKEELVAKKVKTDKPKTEQSSLSERQKKILEFLRAKENAQVWELQRILPEVTKRTLRRDLDELLQLNLVQRKGEWNSVAYQLK